MAVVPMTKIRLYAHKAGKSEILSYLQKKGNVQVENIEELGNVTAKENIAGEVSMIERHLSAVKSALEIISAYDKSKKPIFATRKAIDLSEYNKIRKDKEQILHDALKINAVNKGISESRASIARHRAQMQSYEPWTDFDLPMNFTGTKSTVALIGTIPASVGFGNFCTEIEKDFENISITLINQGSEQISIMLVCHQSEQLAVGDAIRKFGFAKPSFFMPAYSAKQEILKIQKEITQLESDIQQSIAELEYMSGQKDSLQAVYDYFFITKEKYEVRGRAVLTKTSFVVFGYTPEATAMQLKSGIEHAFDCFAEIIPLDEEEQMPVAFDNNMFVSPVEPVTEMFSLPARKDVDPNPIMAVFYYIFFGLMLSDAGYGLVLMIATAIIWWKFKPEGTIGKMTKLFFLGGISSMIWGAIFGSWFGNIIPVVAEQFMNIKMGALGLYDPIKDPMPLLILSFAFGIIHLFTAMGVNFYNLTRNGKLKDAVFDVGFWFLLLSGLIMIIPMPPLGTPMLTKIGTALSLIGAIGLVLTQGRDKKNIFARLFGGLYSLYDVTAYLSDVLSYSRLLALGLATGVIAMVVNTMGTLGGSGVAGAILMAVVFVMGHIMNLLINVLGAYVHTNRLHYVEFFKKFYEGGGKPFRPFAINTKFIKIKEE